MLPGMVNAQLTCEDPLLFTNTQTLVCSGQVTFAQVVPPLEAIEYFWALDGTDIGSTIEPQIAIQWTSPGLYELCVTALCSSGTVSPPACIVIETNALAGADPEPVILCSPDTFYNGLPPGTYSINLVTPEGCDSIVELTIMVYPEGPTDLGTFHLCQADNWTLNGETYSDSGDYVVYDNLPFPPYCFQEIHFSIRPLTSSSYVLTAIPPKDLKATPTLTVKPVQSQVTPSYLWSGPNGFASMNATIHPPAPGLYCVQITQPFLSDPLESCMITLCHTVKSTIPPETDKGPSNNEVDGRSSIKPWLYPVPAKDYICLEWPEANLEGNQFQLFNRWGAEVQSGSFSGSCVDLIALPADTYVMLIILADGAMFKSWITIQE